MKRITSIVLSALLLLTALSGIVTAAETVGIGSAAELDAVRNDLGGNYILKNDIVFTAEDFAAGGAFYNDGRGFLPIGGETPFSGTFDGGGHTISGLCISAECIKDDDSLYAALFGNVCGSGSKTAAVRNLQLKGCTVRMTIPETVSGEITVLEAGIGGIAGMCGSAAVIENCMVSGSIAADIAVSATVKIGGVAGSNFGTISDCRVTAVVGASATSKIYAGGITGYQHGTVKRCWSNTAVGGTAAHVYAGTVIGYSVSADVSGCYYADNGIDAVGRRKSTESATCLSLPTTAEKLVGWDMTGLWKIGSDGQPILRAFPEDRLFDMTLSAPLVTADAENDGNFVLAWQLTLAVSKTGGAFSAEHDCQILQYGIVCAAAGQTLIDYMAGIGSGKVIRNDFGKSSGAGLPLTRVYKTTNYRLKNVKPDRDRFAVCFIEFEVDGVAYTEYTPISAATTNSPTE